MTIISVILWDMDGVLADTTPLHYETWKALLDEQGIPFDAQRFSLVIGRNNLSTLEVLLGHPPSSELLALVDKVKEETFRQKIPGRVKIVPGVLSWLDGFQKRGLVQAVASSAPPENITAVMDALGIAGYFSQMVSGHAIPGKPDPAVFLEAARRLGSPPAACVVIEDSPAGVRAARQAGMFCVAVTTTHTTSELKEAQLILTALEDVPVENVLRVAERYTPPLS